MTENKELRGFQGIFFDDEVQRNLINMQSNGLEKNVNDMHITFKFGKIEKYPQEFIGKDFKVKLVGYASDGKNSGFSVELPDELSKFYKGSSNPHITVSIGKVNGEFGKPVNTGKLDFKPLDIPVQISGKLGYFIYDNGKCLNNDVIDEYEKKIIPNDIKIMLLSDSTCLKDIEGESFDAVVGIPKASGVLAKGGINLLCTEKGENGCLSIHDSKAVPILQNGSKILIDHLVEDVLYGIALLTGRKKSNEELWNLTNFVGRDWMKNFRNLSEEKKDMLAAYKCYEASHRFQKFDEITDVTGMVFDYLAATSDIANGDKGKIEDGRKWYRDLERKIESYLVYENENVRVFKSVDGTFCSSSYYSNSQEKEVKSTITKNEKTKSITLAIADGGKEVLARDVVKELWGEDAGGYSAIASSPVGKQMEDFDLQQLVNLVNEKYEKIKQENEVAYFEPDEV